MKQRLIKFQDVGVEAGFEVGEIALVPMSDGSGTYWLTHSNGEAMQVTAGAIERLLTDYLAENL